MPSVSSYDLLKQYVALAGVDPALIDLAMKTPHNRVHWLTAEELNRYGLVPGDVFRNRSGCAFRSRTGTSPSSSR